MKAKLKCVCGATAWVTCTIGMQGDGVMDGEIIEEHEDPEEWEGGGNDCPHTDYMIVETESHNPFEDERYG